jgi:hypothetical protein
VLADRSYRLWDGSNDRSLIARGQGSGRDSDRCPKECAESVRGGTCRSCAVHRERFEAAPGYGIILRSDDPHVLIGSRYYLETRFSRGFWPVYMRP